MQEHAFGKCSENCLAAAVADHIVRMHLMYTLDDAGNRIYTLKVCFDSSTVADVPDEVPLSRK